MSKGGLLYPEEVCIPDSELPQTGCGLMATSLLHSPVTFFELPHWLLLNDEWDQLKFNFENILETLEAEIHNG